LGKAVAISNFSASVSAIERKQNNFYRCARLMFFRRRLSPGKRAPLGHPRQYPENTVKKGTLFKKFSCYFILECIYFPSNGAPNLPLAVRFFLINFLRRKVLWQKP
jgi:hypothetical protein